MSESILIVDDEKNIRRSLRMVLEGEDYLTLEAETGERALALVEGPDPIDLILLDVKLPGIDGLEALRRLRERPGSQHIPVLMISGHASVSDAMEAVRLGAQDFFEKPLDRDRVLLSVKNALRTSRLEREIKRLRADAERRYQMIGESPAMKALYHDIEKVAPTRGRVLITGESGTGKELIARAIHRLSSRAEAPFVKVNCAAIPSELIESELFGHERGAFTGAQGRKKGMFELADGGTLFLDEIGDMSLSAQAKVLRALQNGEITRVGSERTLRVDVRVLAATNKNLEEAIAAGTFREDLYFRLNVVPLRAPRLEERREDIPALVVAFLDGLCEEQALPKKEIDTEVIDALTRRPWPGNVRELRNIVERMTILSGTRITRADLPEAASVSPRPTGSVALPLYEDGRRLTLKEYRDHAVKRYIAQTLEEHDWNISRAAAALGVERTNLHKKIKSLDIRREELG